MDKKEQLEEKTHMTQAVAPHSAIRIITKQD